MNRQRVEELLARVRECLLLGPEETAEALRLLLARALEEAEEEGRRSSCWKEQRKLPPCS